MFRLSEQKCRAVILLVNLKKLKINASYVRLNIITSPTSGGSSRFYHFDAPISRGFVKYFEAKQLNESGATMLEYSLIASLIGAALIAIVTTTGGKTSAQFAISTCAISCSAPGSGRPEDGAFSDPGKCAAAYQWLRGNATECTGSSNRDVCGAQTLLRRVAQYCG